jgi:trigger factor
MPTETPPIQVTKVAEEPGAKTLKVEVSTDRVRVAEDAATEYFAKRAKVPGFRKGKVPPPVVRKQFRDAIRDRVIQDLVRDSWRLAVDQEGLQPMSDPRLRDLDFKEGAPVRFELLVEVRPEIKLERQGGFRVPRKVDPVTDEMVDRQIEELRRQKATWLPVEGAHPEPGHMVTVSVATISDGAAGEPRQYPIVLGSGQAIPDIEQAITTLLPGQTEDVTVRYPDDFTDESKRGQSRAVRITLHEVKREELPPLDDAFARELGDFDGAPTLRAAVRQDLESAAQREADGAVRQALIDQIVAANEVPAPRPLVHRVLHAYAQAYGVPDDQLERFATEFGPIAERQVRRDLILDHVASEHGLMATAEELDTRLSELAARRDLDATQLRASLQKSDRLREIELGITEDKVFRHLLQQSTVVDE